MGWSGNDGRRLHLLSSSVGPANKHSVQGLSDLAMGIAAASAGALGGFVVAATRTRHHAARCDRQSCR